MSSPMILVIGNGPYQASTAALLRRCGYTVKETTNIIISGEVETLVDSRRWISKNSLRRLDGQDVKVIYPLDAQGRYDESWVDRMCLVFKKHSPFVAAVLQNSKIRSDYKILNKFISNLDSSIVLDNINDDCTPHLERIIGDLEPFRITTETSINTETKAWSSEKVILFGRTGSGKSTIAQMLTLGHLDPTGSSFRASSSARGVTSKIDRAEGRGWHVTDTPGFGEAKGGTVSTTDATNIVKKFVFDTCGTYSHFIYAVKKGRIDVFDARLWKFFKQVFADAEDNFSVAVTGCIDELSAEDKDSLQETFAGCKNFIFVNFCPIESDDPALEGENKEEREKSLLELEDGLARIGVAEKECSEGRFSMEHLSFMKSNMIAGFDRCSKSMGATLDGVLAGIAVPVIQYFIYKPVAAVGRYFHKSAIDEDFFLLPM